MECDVDGSNEKTPLLKYPTIKRMLRQRFLFLLLIPGVIWAMLFAYAPMAGLYMAFIDYKPTLGDFWALFLKRSSWDFSGSSTSSLGKISCA